MVLLLTTRYLLRSLLRDQEQVSMHWTVLSSRS
uniref:Uncharacterized protein n=1 Tax=Arundo donax TaxID=35708 RepID=A0A0A9B665_ARUDO